MARLSENGPWLIQQIGGIVILYHEGSDEEIVRFDPGNRDAASKAQATIRQSRRLNEEEMAFAHFWSGYFYAHATGV